MNRDYAAFAELDQYQLSQYWASKGCMKIIMKFQYLICFPFSLLYGFPLDVEPSSDTKHTVSRGKIVSKRKKNSISIMTCEIVYVINQQMSINWLILLLLSACVFSYCERPKKGFEPIDCGRSSLFFTCMSMWMSEYFTWKWKWEKDESKERLSHKKCFGIETKWKMLLTKRKTMRVTYIHAVAIIVRSHLSERYYLECHITVNCLAMIICFPHQDSIFFCCSLA